MSDRQDRPKKKRSGSETRKPRPVRFTVRCSEAALAAIDAAADGAGLSRASYIMTTLTKEEPPRAERKPPAERAALAQVLGLLGRLNGNVNQIAHHRNRGLRPQEEALIEAMKDIVELRADLMRALGREP